MAKCATQSKRRAIFQVRVNRRERKVVSEGKIVLSGRQRRMVAEQLDSLHTVADCGRHCQSHFSLGMMSQAPKSFGISISGEVYRTLAISRSSISRAALAGLSRPLLILAESLSFGDRGIHTFYRMTGYSFGGCSILPPLTGRLWLTGSPKVLHSRSFVSA